MQMRPVLLLLAAPLLVALRVAPAAAQAVYRLPVHGVIENGLAPYIARGLTAAHQAGAQVVVLDIDTPGGRIDAAERIVDAVRASKVRTVAWVAPRAYSAGAMVALAADEIWMRDGAVLGAATPVDGSGTKAPEKIVSAMRAAFRALAERRGYDPRLAEAMVDESVGAPGYAEPGKLLTLTTQQAVQAGFAKGVADSPEALLNAIGAAGASMITPDITWAEQVVRFLTRLGKNLVATRCSRWTCAAFPPTVSTNASRFGCCLERACSVLFCAGGFRCVLLGAKCRCASGRTTLLRRGTGAE